MVTPPPANTARAPDADVTMLRVSIMPLFYRVCPAKNPIEVTIDGVAVVEDFPCEQDQSYTKADGTRLVVDSSGISRYEMKARPLAPGRHHVRVRHVPSNVSGETDIDLPQYDTAWKPPRKRDLLDVRVPDTNEETEVGKGVGFARELMTGSFMSM